MRLDRASLRLCIPSRHHVSDTQYLGLWTRSVFLGGRILSYPLYWVARIFDCDCASAHLTQAGLAEAIESRLGAPIGRSLKPAGQMPRGGRGIHVRVGRKRG
jgi:hypothetical protein